MKFPYRPFFLAAGLGCLALSAYASPVALQIDKAKSTFAVDVKVTVDSFVGSLSNYEAKILFDPATNQASSAVLTFRFADVKTGKADRDEKMNTWQGTDTFPDGVFILEKLEAAPSGGAQVATGKLSFHGQTLPLSFPVTIVRSGSQVSIKGEAVVDTSAYGLPVIKMMLMLKVDPKVKLRFDLEGSLPAEK